MTSKHKESSTELVPVKFSRLTRRGILLGLSAAQLVTVGIGIATIITALYAGGGMWLSRDSGTSPWADRRRPCRWTAHLPVRGQLISLRSSVQGDHPASGGGLGEAQ